MIYDFGLNKFQINRFEQWKIEQETKKLETKTTFGGRWSFEFIVTSIDIIVVAHDNELNEKIFLN